jgi:hypothetical protein
MNCTQSPTNSETTRSLLDTQRAPAVKSVTHPAGARGQAFTLVDSTTARAPAPLGGRRCYCTLHAQPSLALL